MKTFLIILSLVILIPIEVALTLTSIGMWPWLIVPTLMDERDYFGNLEGPMFISTYIIKYLKDL